MGCVVRPAGDTCWSFIEARGMKFIEGFGVEPFMVMRPGHPYVREYIHTYMHVSVMRPLVLMA